MGKKLTCPTTRRNHITEIAILNDDSCIVAPRSSQENLDPTFHGNDPAVSISETSRFNHEVLSLRFIKNKVTVFWRGPPPLESDRCLIQFRTKPASLQPCIGPPPINEVLATFDIASSNECRTLVWVESALVAVHATSVEGNVFSAGCDSWGCAVRPSVVGEVQVVSFEVVTWNENCCYTVYEMLSLARRKLWDIPLS